jgi:glucose/mannose-6-phosphate isomerase
VSDLSRAAIGAADPEDMLGVVCEQPDQLEDALVRVDAARLGRLDAPAGLAICGMGGSAIGGDLAAAAIGRRAARPVLVVRDYAPPPWVGEGWLVLCSSYSGGTEETVAAFEAAGRAGARRVVLTTGGALAEAARAGGVPVIAVPGGMQPRAAVVYTLVGALACAAACGAAPSLREEVEAAARLAGELVEEWGADAAAGSLAKDLASALAGTVPIVHGSDATAPVAARWKSQVNENAKRHAFLSTLPEAAHNEICAWGGDAFSAVFLEDRDQHPRVRRRIELIAGVAEAAGAPVQRVEGRGETRLERIVSLVLLGDLVSVYLAALAGVDPTPVEAIERLKRELG